MTREQFIFEVRVCQGPLRRFLTTLCNGDSARGDDLAQETMLRAWLASDRFRGSFRPWLFRIAYNVFVDHFRRQRQGIDTMDDVGTERVPADTGADEAFRHEALTQALGCLPLKERTALILHYWEDLPVKEIASVMRVPSGTVKYWLHQGRNHLKALLQHE